MPNQPPFHAFDDGYVMKRIGKKLAGRVLDGRTVGRVPFSDWRCRVKKHSHRRPCPHCASLEAIVRRQQEALLAALKAKNASKAVAPCNAALRKAS